MFSEPGTTWPTCSTNSRRRADRRLGVGPTTWPTCSTNSRRRADRRLGVETDRLTSTRGVRLTLDELRRRRRAKWRFEEPDVLPLWVAEMDVRLAAHVTPRRPCSNSTRTKRVPRISAGGRAPRPLESSARNHGCCSEGVGRHRPVEPPRDRDGLSPCARRRTPARGTGTAPRPVRRAASSRTKSTTWVPRSRWCRYRCPAGDAVDVAFCDSQWNSSGLMA